MKKTIAFIVIALMLMGTGVVLAQDTDTPEDEVDTSVETAEEETADEIVEATVETAEDTANWLDDLLDRLTQAPQSDLARLLFLIGGALLLLGGWRIYDYIVIVAGFLIGALLAIALIDSENTILLIAAFLVGGLLGGALSVYVYAAAVFVIGAYIGIVLTAGIIDLFTNDSVSSLILLLGGLVGGLLLVGLSFEFLIIISVVVGAQMIALAMGLSPTWTLLFAVLGLIVQFAVMRNYKYDFRRRRRPVYR